MLTYADVCRRLLTYAARRAGDMVLKESLGEEEGDCVWTAVARENRGVLPPADAEKLLGQSLRYTSQRPTGGLGCGGVRWRQVCRRVLTCSDAC